MQPLRKEEEPRSARQVSGGEPVTSAQALERLERAIDARLGAALREGVQPLVDEVREHLGVLEPEAHGVLPAPKELAERRAKLAQALDAMEDVLEGLYVAARGGLRPTPGREG